MPDTRISSTAPKASIDAHRIETSKQASSSADHRGHTIKPARVADNLDALSAPNPLLKKMSERVHEAAVMVGLASATEDLNIPKGHLIQYVREPKNPQLHSHAYHKWCGTQDGLTREQQRAQYESYRLKPAQLLDGGVSQTTQTLNGAENSGRPAQSPLLQVAENIEAQTKSSLEESFVMVAGPDEEVRSKPTAATNATRSPVAVPNPTSPILIALDDLELNISDGLRMRLETHHQKIESFRTNKASAIQSNNKAKASQALAHNLNVGSEMAGKYGRDILWSEIDRNAPQLAKDALNELSTDLRFLAVLKVAALAAPEDLSLEHKELLAFLGQNINSTLAEASGAVEELQQNLKWGRGIIDKIDFLLKGDLQPEDRSMVEAARRDGVKYIHLVSNLLSDQVDVANQLVSVQDMGSTLREAEATLRKGYINCQHAVANLRNAVNELAVEEYDKTKSPKKTLRWAEQQPWNSLIKIEFQNQGRFTDLVPTIRAADAREVGNPLHAPSRAEMRDLPLKVYNGLLSPEMREDLQITQTGQNHNGLPVIEKPSLMALAWGDSLSKAMRQDPNYFRKLPDFMSLNEVYYREASASSDKPETLKRAWVAGYSLTKSGVIQSVEDALTQPQQIAREIAAYFEKKEKLHETQDLQKAQIGVARLLVEQFVRDSGTILIHPLEVATSRDLQTSTDVLLEVQAQVQREISEQLELNGHNIAKTEKWVQKQPWIDLFNVNLSTKNEGGEKSTHLNIRSKTPADVEDPKQSGLAILSQPNIRESLRLTPLKISGASLLAASDPDVVKKPSTLARYLGSVFADKDEAFQLPPFLELKQVQYHSEARLIGRGQLKTCWVVEFKPEFFSQQNAKA